MDSATQITSIAPIETPSGFFRFETNWYAHNRHPQLGIFRSAGRLEGLNEMNDSDKLLLKHHLWWFGQNLAAPRRLRRRAAVFWFRPDARRGRELWNRAREIAELLRRYDFNIDIWTTTRPGKIVYHDEVQIAAVPFNDTYKLGTVVSFCCDESRSEY